MSDAPTPTADQVFAIDRRFRLQYEDAQSAWVLLYPEGMVKLNGSAGEILKRLDGVQHNGAVIATLERDFEQTGLERDVLGFLGIAWQQGWVRPVDATARDVEAP